MAYSFKLDENLSPSLKAVLESAGHDVKTASEQGLQGAPDKKIADVCKSESRCLITADHGFGQILTYPPETYAGLIILRHPNPRIQNVVSMPR